MTEPVAYMLSDFVDNDFTSLELPTNPNNPRGLYFKEQLHPRVKMTKKQYNRLMWDKENTDLFQCLDYFHEHDGNSKFGALTEDLRGDLAPEDIARAWLDEETIEIVPTMKWFVQMKNENEKTRFLHRNLFDRNHVLNYGSLKYYAKYFDTKEEAELWTTPDTEAVQLPVEEKL